MREKLPQNYRELCENPAVQIFLSVASVWEMQIKLASGKLRLNQPLALVVARQQAINGVQVLPIELRHTLALAELPDIHKDPFDRMLIAQTRSDDLTLLSVDSVFIRYAVRIIAPT